MVTGTSAGMTPNVIGAATMHAPTIKSDRRSNKPIMEKRRRARINNCLNELKTLILDATKKDPARHSKLEKADILEKTVKHLQELQRQQSVFKQATDAKVINKFKAGFTECANEVSRFPGLEPALKRRLIQHLSGCINSVKTDLPDLQHQLNVMHTHMLPSPPSSPEQESSSHLEQIKYTANAYFLTNGQQMMPTKFIMAQQPFNNRVLNTPLRTSSTCSASSQSSLMAYEPAHHQHVYANASSNSQHNFVVYNPPSPANSFDTTMEYLPLRLAQQHQQQQQQQLYIQQQQQQQQQQQHIEDQQPLSLVMKKYIKQEEELPWRPW